MLTLLGGTAAVGIAAALMLALWPHANHTGQELLSTDNKATPDGLNTLPRDYTGLPKPVPQLGTPLPGDLGRPMLNAGVPAPGMPQPTPPAQPDPEAQRLAQEQARLAQELESARTSRLFISEARAAAPAAGLPALAPTTGDAMGQGGPGAATPARQPSEGDRKLAFLNGDVDRRTVSADRVAAPASRNVVQAGAVIPAALLTGTALRPSRPDHRTGDRGRL